MGRRSDGRADLEAFLRHLAAERRLSSRTVEAYRRDLEGFARFLDGYLASREWKWGEVDRLAVRGWLGELAGRGLGRSTVARRLAALRSFYRFLNRSGRSAEDPARRVRAPRGARRLPGYLSAAQTRTLFDLLEAKVEAGGGFAAARDLALLEVLYSCGLRLAEAHALDLSDVDLRDRTVRVTGKGRKERIVPMGGKAARALERYLARRRRVAEGDAVAGRRGAAGAARRALFLSRRGGRLSRRQIARRVSAALERVAPGEGLSTHALRHTFATHLLDRGAGIMAVKELLGHASLSTTRGYTHTSVEGLRRAYRQAHPRAE